MRRREFITLLAGATVVAPLTARAQQTGGMRRIGVLLGSYTESDKAGQARIAAFLKALADLGWNTDRNIRIEYRWGAGDTEQTKKLILETVQSAPDAIVATSDPVLAQLHGLTNTLDVYEETGRRIGSQEVAKLADDLVHRQVNVIAIPNTTQSAIAAKAATQTIPIVFSLGSNPVEVGLVQSLNHPGGNVTGLTALQTAVTAKRLELVHQLIPGITKIAFLVNPANRALAENDTKEAQDSARAFGINLLNLGASNPSEIDAAFEILAREQAEALLTNSESLFMIHSTQLAILTARHRVPALYAYRENAVAGGLMSYGANFLNAARELGVYVGRVLKGDKSADLPVQQASKIELVINLKTAKALGLTVPLSLLGRADEVIE